MSQSDPTLCFAHQRLDAYRVAVQLFRQIEEVTARFPRGHADLKDQMRRSAAATVRHIAEGANRFEPRRPRARRAPSSGACPSRPSPRIVAQKSNSIMNRRSYLAPLSGRITYS